MQTEWQTVQTLISSLIWVCTVCPDMSVRKLRIITVVTVCPSILSPNTYFNFFPGGNTCTLLCHSWANYGATMPPKRVHVICGPEPPKAKGPMVMASTNKRLFDLLQWSFLVESCWIEKNFADPMELMRLIRKRLNKFSYVMFWDCPPLVKQSQNLKF